MIRRVTPRGASHGLLALVLLLAMTVTASADSLAIEPYRIAASRGEVGSIEGQAHVERRLPDATDTPLTGLVLVLMPLSEPLLTEVERVKAGARDSMEAFQASAPRIKVLEEAYEWAIWEGGGADLLQSSVIGPDGVFAFADVPAGRWLLFGRLETASPVVPRKAKPADVAPFDMGPQVVGHRAAAFWLVPISVSAGEAAEVTLTDRNIWHTGVLEELKDSGERPLGAKPKAKTKNR
jgi:hypothetical protein